MSGASWLSYSLQDFLMFGPEVFLRLFVRINQEAWPLVLLALLAAVAIPVLAMQANARFNRGALGVLALAWGVSGYGFLVHYFGPINWPAAWFGWAFVVQGLVLGGVALFGRVAHGQGALAALWVMAVLALPWLPVAESGNWQALALFGLAPGTTAAASTLLLPSLAGKLRWLLLIVPVLWAVFSAAMAWALHLYWLLLTPLATLVFIALGFWLSPSPAQSRG